MGDNFRQIQLELAQQIRNGEEATQFESRRLGIYQSLFYNNIEGFCANAFPVLKSILDNQVWHNWVRSFFINTNNHSPFFSEIAEQFLEFIAEQANNGDSTEEQYSVLNDKPWLVELAHYEWAELYVSLQEGTQLTAKADCFVSEPQLSQLVSDDLFTVAPSALPLAYQHPVQTISADNASEIPQVLTTLIVHQAPINNSTELAHAVGSDIEFVQTDPLTIHLLSFLQQEPQLSDNEIEVSGHTLNDMVLFLTSPSIGLETNQAEEFLQKALPDLVERGVLIIE